MSESVGSTGPEQPATGPTSVPGAPPPPPFSPPPPRPGASQFGAKLPPIDPSALSKTPWVLGAVGILAALVLFWFGSIISAFASGLSARERIVSFLSPGAAPWALAILLAVALLVLGSATEQRTALVGFLYQLLLIIAAVIALAAVVNAIIELTFIGDSASFALSNFFEYLAGVPIAGAAGLWAYRSNPTAIPGMTAGPAR